MGLLESVVGSLFGGSNQTAGNQSAGMGSVLSDILGGGGQTGASGAGGLGGLIQMAEQAGLGNVVQSWIGSGSNHPVSPSDLQNIFGDRVPDMAQQAGMNQGDFLSELARHLPGAVDQATPNGQISNEGSVDV